MKSKILVLDDDKCVLESFQTALSKKEIDLVPELYTTPEEALKAFKTDPYSYSVAFVDYQYKNENGAVHCIGHEIARELKMVNPGLVVLIMSGDESEEAAQKWAEARVDKIMYKPVRAQLIRALTVAAIEDYENNYGSSDDDGGETVEARQRKIALKRVNLVGGSVDMEKIAKQVAKFARSSHSFLLLGETGVGKEVIAKAIHDNSDRSRKDMVVINCASIPDHLFESELFGHVKGAFTGAHQDKKGSIQLSEGSTLFLDEIHYLSIKQQAKLLRVIQERKIRRVGGDKEFDVDFRLIVAAKENILDLCQKGEFLPDLYYRIAAAHLATIKPLRERPDDILPLIKHFQILNEIKNDLKQKKFTRGAIDKLKIYQWPGNIRELKTVIDKVYMNVEGNLVREHDLPEEVIIQSKFKMFEEEKVMRLEELESRQKKEKISLVFKALEIAKDNKTKAAELLGLKRTTFNSLLKSLGVEKVSKSKRLNFINMLLGRQNQEGELV